MPILFTYSTSLPVDSLYLTHSSLPSYVSLTIRSLCLTQGSIRTTQALYLQQERNDHPIHLLYITPSSLTMPHSRFASFRYLTHNSLSAQLKVRFPPPQHYTNSRRGMPILFTYSALLPVRNRCLTPSALMEYTSVTCLLPINSLQQGIY